MMTESFLDELFLCDLMLKDIKPNYNDEGSILCKHNTENSCVYACVFIWLTNVILPWRSQAGEVLILRCSVFWRGLIQLSSCHTLPFPRTRSNKTHKHTSTLWTPSFSFFPLVYPPLLACLGSVLIFQHCSVHLLIRSTGSSGNVQTLFSSQLAEGITLHHCMPPWPWNPNTLSHRRHKPSLPAQLARTPSLHQTRSGCRCQVLLQTPASICSGCKDDGMKFNIPKEPIKFHVLRFTLLVILNILNMLFEYFSREEGENLITFLGNRTELWTLLHTQCVSTHSKNH